MKARFTDEQFIAMIKEQEASKKTADVCCKALAAHQTICNTPRDGLLKQVAQQFAVPKAPVPVLGEGRMIWHWIRQIEAAEPAICEVQMHLFAQPAL